MPEGKYQKLGAVNDTNNATTVPERRKKIAVVVLAHLDWNRGRRIIRRDYHPS
jgi:hypothetical protein